jgi:hypothetical protein
MTPPRGANAYPFTAPDRFQFTSTSFTALAAVLLLATGTGGALGYGAQRAREEAARAGAGGGPIVVDGGCAGARDTAWLDSLAWPLDSAQAVRRATAVLRGGSSLELPLRVAAYERAPRRVAVTLAADVERRVVLACGSGRVAVYPNGSAVVEARYTAP